MAPNALASAKELVAAGARAARSHQQLAAERDHFLDNLFHAERRRRTAGLRREARAALSLKRRCASARPVTSATRHDRPLLTIAERSNIETGSWFSKLSPPLRDSHPARAVVRRVGDGAMLSARGAPAEEWCGVAKGAVRVSSVSLSGKQITLTYVEPGTWFGDIALFDGLPRTHDANAHGETTLLVVRKADFRELLSQHVELYEALLRLNCRRLRLLFDAVEDLNTRPLGLAPGQADPAAGAQLRRRSRARRSASACSSRRRTWPSCSAPRASASTRN